MVKIGVIGVGNMGRNHVRNILELPQHYELVGCYDNSEENSKIINDKYGIRLYSDAESLLRETDAVVLAVPSSLHLHYGLLAAKHLNHALIEKPIALSKADGLRLCDEFSHIGKTLMVGHIERFNPVVSVMKDILENESNIVAIEARRCGPHFSRVVDTNVIFDLMIHDLDIVLNYLHPAPVVSVQANAVIAKSTTHQDYVHASLQHDTGVISSVLSSRITADKIRLIDVHTENTLIRGDLLNKTLSIIRNTVFSFDTESKPLYKQESVIEKVMLPIIEPLKRELAEFAAAIKEKREPLTCGLDAINALRYAEHIHELTKNCPTVLNIKGS